MKSDLMEDFPDMDKTVGDYRLCAWPTSEGSCRIQTSDREIAKALAKLPDCKRVGYSVRGSWMHIYAMPYTLGWVTKNVIAKFTLQFPRKKRGSKIQKPCACVFS
jgi:hypothetical protein